MRVVKVRAKEGRIAYTAPTGGKLIPTDRYIGVPLDSWISRLLVVHGDIELEQKKAKQDTKPTPEPVTKG